MMNEDNGLKRKNFSAENFNMMRKIALGMVSGDTEIKAAIDDKYKEKLLKI